MPRAVVLDEPHDRPTAVLSKCSAPSRAVCDREVRESDFSIISECAVTGEWNPSKDFSGRMPTGVREAVRRVHDRERFSLRPVSDREAIPTHVIGVGTGNVGENAQVRNTRGDLVPGMDNQHSSGSSRRLDATDLKVAPYNFSSTEEGALKAAVNTAETMFTNADGLNAFTFVNRVTGMWPSS